MKFISEVREDGIKKIRIDLEDLKLPENLQDGLGLLEICAEAGVEVLSNTAIDTLNKFVESLTSEDALNIAINIIHMRKDIAAGGDIETITKHFSEYLYDGFTNLYDTAFHFATDYGYITEDRLFVDSVYKYTYETIKKSNNWDQFPEFQGRAFYGINRKYFAALVIIYQLAWIAISDYLQQLGADGEDALARAIRKALVVSKSNGSIFNCDLTVLMYNYYKDYPLPDMVRSNLREGCEKQWVDRFLQMFYARIMPYLREGVIESTNIIYENMYLHASVEPHMEVMYVMKTMTAAK
jgi:hypothetical protein